MLAAPFHARPMTRSPTATRPRPSWPPSRAHISRMPACYCQWPERVRVTMMPMAHEPRGPACRTLRVMSGRAGLEAQLHAEYRLLLAALGPWRNVFDLRDTPSHVTTR